MAIIGLQRRIREVGRIRMGIQAPTSTGRRAPKKLDKFRLTSPDRAVIEAVAATYGGEVEQWTNPRGQVNGPGAQEYEVITTANELRIALPPNPGDMAWSQSYESWANGFCTKRCNGEWDQIADRACTCDPENRECKATSRLSVLLPDIAGLGLWRLESHGYYAAVELAGAIDLIQQMAGAHAVIPARLRLDQREVRRLVNGKAKVHKFAVPVIDLDVSIFGVQAIAMRVGDTEVQAGEGLPELPSGWSPVPEVEPPAVLSVVSQVEEATKPKTTTPRKNAAAPLPATGRKPRTAAEAQEEGCALCGKPYGAEPLVRNPTGPGRYIHKSCKDRSGQEANGDTLPEPNEAPTTMDEPKAPTPPVDGGGGPSSTDAEPLSTVARAPDTTPGVPPDAVPAQPPHTAASQLQNRKMHAMVGKLWPDASIDEKRRISLDICSALGTPGLTSRSQMHRDLATVFIDALEAIEAGQVEWRDEDGKLIDLATGEVIGFKRGEL
jgi:hypothetical protein